MPQHRYLKSPPPCLRIILLLRRLARKCQHNWLLNAIITPFQPGAPREEILHEKTCFPAFFPTLYHEVKTLSLGSRVSKRTYLFSFYERNKLGRCNSTDKFWGNKIGVQLTYFYNRMNFSFEDLPVIQSAVSGECKWRRIPA